jgi:demethylmenaquinone methyltransferase / 2-methoxy-6-polyprenyl-1,4-benzoquinol methylase
MGFIGYSSALQPKAAYNPQSLMPPPTPQTVWNDALLSNPHAVADKRSRVQSMFAAIAPSYDLNNRLHSLWMDQWWRRTAVKLAALRAGDRVVDVACGTGDLALRFARRLPANSPRVIGVDFTHEMLPIARRKDEKSAVLWLNGDALCLPLPDASADVISIAFGIRNVSDPAAACREFRRVLRPGGRLVILEFSLPSLAVLRGLYNFYFRRVLPRTATWISGDKTGAYRYLPESVNTFIDRPAMMNMMTAAGFSQVTQTPMTFGICVCYRGLIEAKM